jgi:DNA-binding CsgD family transcriptional regulator
VFLAKITAKQFVKHEHILCEGCGSISVNKNKKKIKIKKYIIYVHIANIFRYITTKSTNQLTGVISQFSAIHRSLPNTSYNA